MELYREKMEHILVVWLGNNEKIHMRKIGNGKV